MIKQKNFYLNEQQGHFAPVVRLSSRFQHTFNENTVPSRWIVHQHMSNRTHQLAILNDRTAAHALDDAAGTCQQSWVCDFQQEIPAVGAGFGIDF